jgi:hypothetical protein
MNTSVESRMITRRQMLKIGGLGMGLSLSGYLRAIAENRVPVQDRSAILVFLKGGPSHQDTFDLKPEAPAEYRGEFRPIPTNVAGVEICEHLPRLARRADQYALVRGISHNLADHGIGTTYLMTGNRPVPTVRYPMYGSVVSKEFRSPPDLPAFVSIDRPVEGPGYLGTEYGPLSTGEKPRYGQPFRVRGVTLDDGLTIEKYRSRRALLEDIDTFYRGLDSNDDHVRSMDRFSQQAFEMISSPRCRQAFDLSQEPLSEADRFGRHEFGQSLLLTARLIEAGVRFVTVLIEDWDTHQDNFNALAGRLLPPLDLGLAALFDRLGERGLLSSTSILVTGEFGRTPKVNGNAGRDHWARAMCALMAGAGIQPGQVFGATNDKAEEPIENGSTPDDLAATFFSSIGINPQREYGANVGRPITLVRDGTPISQLLATSSR